jgi:hypothetical protein
MKTATLSASADGIDRRPSSLVEFALRGLTVMKEPGNELFCHRVVKRADGLRLDGSSLRYSLITLLGLSAAERIGMPSAFDTAAMFEYAASHLETLTDLGNLSILLWLCAQRDPSRLEFFARESSLRARIESLKGFRSGSTMELSWLLAALAHIRLAALPAASQLAELAHSVFRMLLRNQGPHGLFRHGHYGNSSLATSLRSWLGSFADQIYPIYALAQYARAWDLNGAVGCATKCADTLCALQGPLGQWWWHYDSLRGRAVGHYPVFAVHQDGMAPMALFALGRLSGSRYDRAAYNGLNWIYGENELGADMCDPSTGLIWRSLYENRMNRYSGELLAVLGLPRPESALHVLYECRPYHLGWLLYAFCPQLTQASAS